MSKPITPTETKLAADKNIPDYVIDVFNELIVKNYNHGSRSAQIFQDNAIDWIIIEAGKRGIELTRDQIFNRHMLDIEEVFTKAGWKVSYDSPGWGDTHKAFYWFMGAV